jgi:predicted TIM-barrel fold metal-dependent hydrolase
MPRCARIRPLALGGAGALADQAVTDARRRRASPTSPSTTPTCSDARAGTRPARLTGANGHRPSIGSASTQLVFSTFAATQFGGDDRDLLYGGSRAHNRAISDFCSEDKRLVAVGMVPWGDPERTEREADEAIRLGCGAILLNSAPQGDRSPTHPDYNGLWARLQEANIPFMLHIGGGGRTLRRQFHNNGKPTTDWLGGGENIRAKDFMVAHNPPETFLSCMVLDGVFEAFPRLRGGCIEQGALWVPSWLRRLDIAQDTFSKTEPALRLPKRASEYVHGHVWFTPFPTEPVGWLIEQAGDDLFLFSSDYPHPEGGRDPLRRFEESLGATAPAVRETFYSAHFNAMMRRSVKPDVTRRPVRRSAARRRRGSAPRARAGTTRGCPRTRRCAARPSASTGRAPGPREPGGRRCRRRSTDARAVRAG